MITECAIIANMYLECTARDDTRMRVEIVAVVIATLADHLGQRGVRVVGPIVAPVVFTIVADRAPLAVHENL